MAVSFIGGINRSTLRKPLTNWLAAASDKVYQLLVHGRRFYPGTPASSTTKTGRHDIAEILLTHWATRALPYIEEEQTLQRSNEKHKTNNGQQNTK
jgi:hypothetical protein